MQAEQLGEMYAARISTLVMPPGMRCTISCTIISGDKSFWNLVG